VERRIVRHVKLLHYVLILCSLCKQLTRYEIKLNILRCKSSDYFVLHFCGSLNYNSLLLLEIQRSISTLRTDRNQSSRTGCPRGMRIRLIFCDWLNGMQSKMELSSSVEMLDNLALPWILHNYLSYRTDIC
jgi:hypothetical protein